MRFLLAITLQLLASGCDPGWTYHVQRHSTSTTEASAGGGDSSSLYLRLLEARVFAGSLDIRTTVVDSSGQLTPLDSVSVQVLDRSATVLPSSWVTGCGIGSRTVQLASCSPRAYVSVTPIALFRRNPALRELTVRVEGVTRSHRRVALTLPLEWDN
jgi:hypothetical protein